MAGEKGDHKAAPFVHDHHGGVGKFILYMGSNGPHGNAAGADEDEGVPALPGLCRPRLQRAAGCRPGFRGQSGRYVEGGIQMPGYRLSQLRSPAGKGNDGGLHSRASRQPWLKVGS